MTTYTPAHVEKYEAQARALIVEGFDTKAAQGRARDLASRAYSEAKSILGDKVSYTVMCDVPYETNNFRAKHSAAILSACPAAAAEVALIERAVALYAEIKAAPVAPKSAAKKLNDAHQLAMRSDAFNPVLRAEFMKRAPEIKADYIAEVRAVATMLVEKFGNNIPAYVRDQLSRSQTADHAFFAMHADWVKAGTSHVLVLNEALVEKLSTQYGEVVALQWFYKTNAKLGELVDATLVRDMSGDVIVAGVKADGTKVSMRQQRILKRAPVAGKLFNQFPAMCYVDGKFITAEQYARRFNTSNEE